MQFAVAYDRNVFFKTENNLNPTFMKDIFAEKMATIACESQSHLQLPKIRISIYGTENIQFGGRPLWSSLANSLEDGDTLQEFKRRIKPWLQIV